MFIYWFGDVIYAHREQKLYIVKSAGRRKVNTTMSEEKNVRSGCAKANRDQSLRIEILYIHVYKPVCIVF